jgi:rubrerythrin
MNKEEFQNSETLFNLCRAFLMESQNGARYKFMEEKCNEQKYCYLAQLVKKASDRCFAAAQVFYTQIEQNMKDDSIELDCDDLYPFRKASLAENFLYSSDEAAISRDEIYPEFARVAKEEGFAAISEKFELMLQMKDCLYMEMLQISQKMETGKLYEEKTPKKWKCDNCGHEHTSKQAWDKCPFCGFLQGHVVVEIDESKKEG